MTMKTVDSDMVEHIMTNSTSEFIEEPKEDFTRKGGKEIHINDKT